MTTNSKQFGNRRNGTTYKLNEIYELRTQLSELTSLLKT